MALMRSTDHPELLDIPLRKIFFMEVKDVPPEYTTVMNVIETKVAYEDDLRMAEFGDVPQVSEGDSIFFEDMLEGGTKRYESLEYVLGFQITKKMREDDRHGIMVQATKALRKSFRHLFETVSFYPFNNATSATTARQKGFDTLALLSTAHTNLGNGDTQSNKPATDVTLSQTALEAAQQAFHGWTGEKGLPALKTPRIALVDGSDQHLAAKLMRNAMRYDTANNEENWTRQGPDDNGLRKYVPSRYFTATNQWFVLDKKSEHSVNLFVRKHPEFDTSTDFNTGNFLGKGRARLISSFSHWLGVYGSKGY